MGLRLQMIEELAALEALADEWSSLAERAEGGGLFRSPDWLLPWWHAYRGVLGAELFSMALYDEAGALVGLAPMYRRIAKVGPGIKVREIRLLGDAGPRPPELDLLVDRGHEEAMGIEIARHLHECESAWDVLDLEPLQDPSRVRAFTVNRLASAGYHVESAETGGARRLALDVPGAGPADLEDDSAATEYTGDETLVRKGISVLTRLSRLEWADGEERSPLADAQARQLFDEVAARMAPKNLARIARVETRDGAAYAAALVLDEGNRAVVVAMAIDPEEEHRDGARRLITAQAKSALARGRTELELVTGAKEYPLPPLPCSRVRALRVCAYTHSGAAKVARTYSAVRRRARFARVAPEAAASGARAAWTKIRSAAAQVAERERVHLYRGELWTRGIGSTAGLSMKLIDGQEIDSWGESERQELHEVLELDYDEARLRWQRGDLAVYASIDGRPAGIGWCALNTANVPELDRDIHLGRHQAYIHDFFVAPAARGRAVAPSMLEFLAHELRQRDYYRSWALIGADNAPSIRAFEKASYVAVADIIYTRVANMDRIVLRPPDPEAKQLLGL